MRIPNNTIYTSRIRTYGTSGLPVNDMTEQAGCPALFKAKYEDFRVKEPASYPMSFGSVIHDALFLMEEEGLPVLPDALEKAWGRSDVALGPDAWTEAVDMLETYMSRPDDGTATLAVEQHLTMKIMDYKGEEWFAGGYLDRIAVDPNDPSVLYVDDYKTNRAPPSQADVDNDPQFSLYMLLAKANLHKWLPGVDPEEITIIGRMDAVRWYVLSTTREPYQLEQFEDFLRAISRKIIDDEAGEPVLNPGCSWCPIRFDCKEFRKLPGKGETLRDRMSVKTDLEQRVYLMQEAQNVLRMLKPMVDDVRTELLETTTTTGEPLVVNGVEYLREDAWETDIDMLALSTIMGDDFLNRAKLSQKDIDEWVRKHPDQKDAVEACKSRRVKGDKLSARKAK